MSHVEKFLSEVEEQSIINAILEAERNTSGEIRVHLEATTKLPVFERAKEVFHYLKMDNTKYANGVLIYVAVDDKKFSICGDKGIDAVVASDFWDMTKNTIQRHFKKGAFKDGLISGILTAGKALSSHFPYEEGDINELPNEISKG